MQFRQEQAATLRRSGLSSARFGRQLRQTLVVRREVGRRLGERRRARGIAAGQGVLQRQGRQLRVGGMVGQGIAYHAAAPTLLPVDCSTTVWTWA
jgi:hypothetical protein